ncbi:MAG: hypothetical protein OHK0011_25260 [Turneriella sp.]
MIRSREPLATAIALTAMLLTACASGSLRAGESRPLKDSSGKTFGTRYQLTEFTERHDIDVDGNGIPEKQYFFERDVLSKSEHFYPDGKPKVITYYLEGKPNRAEIFHPDGRLRAIAYYESKTGRLDTVDLPERKRRVEFLPQN